jgi:hypothetical protein
MYVCVCGGMGEHARYRVGLLVVNFTAFNGVRLLQPRSWQCGCGSFWCWGGPWVCGRALGSIVDEHNAMSMPANTESDTQSTTTCCRTEHLNRNTTPLNATQYLCTSHCVLLLLFQSLNIFLGQIDPLIQPAKGLFVCTQVNVPKDLHSSIGINNAQALWR